jgi:hypothetical protein
LSPFCECDSASLVRLMLQAFNLASATDNISAPHGCINQQECSLTHAEAHFSPRPGSSTRGLSSTPPPGPTAAVVTLRCRLCSALRPAEPHGEYCSFACHVLATRYDIVSRPDNPFVHNCHMMGRKHAHTCSCWAPGPRLCKLRWEVGLKACTARAECGAVPQVSTRAPDCRLQHGSTEGE